MLSVFKLPLALTVLHRVEERAIALDQPVRFLPQDRILPSVYSPLQDKFPAANVDISVEELLRLSVLMSDNVAADVLLRLIGGPTEVNSYIAALGVNGFNLENNESALHRDVSLVYKNWFEPAGAVQLLRLLDDHPPLTGEHLQLLRGWMSSSRMARLDGDLPRDVHVAHKAGTSDVVNGVAIATNDIGLIRLPDGRELAIAVFITDSTDDQPTRDKIVARVARAAYDEAINGSDSIKYPSAQKSLPVLHTSTLEATVTHVINVADSAHPAGRPTLVR
jgi:beta-lactamase class A